MVSHVETVSSFDVNLATQKVIVKGNAPYADVLAAIKKTGKEVSIIGTPLRILLI